MASTINPEFAQLAQHDDEDLHDGEPSHVLRVEGRTALVPHWRFLSIFTSVGLLILVVTVLLFERIAKGTQSLSSARPSSNALPMAMPSPPLLRLLDDDYNETIAAKYIQYARATVCTKEELESWDCGEMCEATPASPPDVVFLGPGRRFEMQGYVAALPASYDHEHGRFGGARRHCVVAFRGTVELHNKAADAESMLSTPWPPGGADWCLNCAVGMGFSGAYEELRESLWEALRGLGCGDASLTGHSLGGAMAILAAFELRALLGFRASPVYTFGAPRVGNQAFADAFTELSMSRDIDPPAWRVIHYKDPVPRLGHWAVTNGRHSPREVYYYTEIQDKYRICSSTNGEDPKGANSIPWYDCVRNMNDHLSYFNKSRHITCKRSGVDPWKYS